MMTDSQSIIMSVVAGELDFMARHLAFSDYPLLMENRERGNYQVYRWPFALGSGWAFMPNMNHRDPVIKEIFEDKRFRLALSLAIDRDEINEIVYYGAGKPRAATVVPGCPYYEEDFEYYGVGFDLDKANALLDEMGLERGPDGMRRRPDGERLELRVETIDGMVVYGNWVDIVEMTVDTWRELDIVFDINIPDRALLSERWSAGEFDISGWAWGRGLTPLIAPKFVFPSDTSWNPGPVYGRYYQSDGAQGEAPAADSDVRLAWELYEQYTTEPDPEARVEIGKELIRLSTENIWSIGTVGEVPAPVIVSDRMGNVPESILSEHMLQTPTNARPQQFYVKQ